MLYFSRGFVLIVAIILDCGFAFADVYIGDWKMSEGYITNSKELHRGIPPDYGISAATKWNYDKSGRSSCTIDKSKWTDFGCGKLSLDVRCKADRYTLVFVTVCQNCGQSRAVSVSVTIDSSRQFDLQGVDSISGGQKSGQASVVEAPLTAEQVSALSQSRRSILATTVGRAPIYVEPDGTAAAFATLAAACKWTKP